MSLKGGEKKNSFWFYLKSMCTVWEKKYPCFNINKGSFSSAAWETPQFKVDFQRFSRAITVAAEKITDNVLFIHTKHVNGLQKKINIYSLITVYSLYSNQLSLTVPSLLNAQNGDLIISSNFSKEWKVIIMIAQGKISLNKCKRNCVKDNHTGYFLKFL